MQKAFPFSPLIPEFFKAYRFAELALAKVHGEY